MKDLNWENLLEKKCPMCNSNLEEKSTSYVCANHREPYKISKLRFKVVSRSLQEAKDFSTDFISNF